jgi:hypothetical protein
LKVFIDTNIFIDIFRKKESIVDKFIELSKCCEFYYNPIIEAELLQGVKKEQEKKGIEFVLSKIVCLDITKYTGQIAGEFAKQYLKSHSTVTLDDFLIAATVKQHNLKLWTQNKKHFPMFNESSVV